MGVGLCRQHAIELEQEIDRHNGLGPLIEQVMKGRDPFVVVVGAVQGFLGKVVADRAQARAQQPPNGSQSRWQSQQQQQQRAQTPPRSPRPPPPIDPTIKARELLGFEPTEKLTIDKIRARKQALARVFHPDTGPNGSEAQMKRINDAADTLLAKIR